MAASFQILTGESATRVASLIGCTQSLKVKKDADGALHVKFLEAFRTWNDLEGTR